MNSIVVLILGLIVFYIGYRIYAKYIDTKVIKADPKRATPAKMYMDGVEFMPTSKNILFGYQFKSIAGAAPIIGPIIAIQWGWLPALIWILGGALFIGWVQDYSSADGGHAKRGRFLWRLEPQADLSQSPNHSSVVHLFLSAAHCRCLRQRRGQHRHRSQSGSHGLALSDHRRRPGRPDDLSLEKGYHPDHGRLRTDRPARHLSGHAAPSDKILGASLANSRVLWAIAAFVFCYFAAVLPIWRFALPINYVASYIVFLGLFFGIIGIFVLHPESSPSGLYSIHHQDRTDLADHVRHHRLRGHLRMAQHRLQLRDGTAAGE